MEEMGRQSKKGNKKLEKEALERLNNGILQDLRSYYKKLIEDLETEEQENYNICLYQIAPYPPNTKELKDFYLQRREAT
jgi:hypothetical protein